MSDPTIRAALEAAANAVIATSNGFAGREEAAAAVAAFLRALPMPSNSQGYYIHVLADAVEQAAHDE